MSPSVRHHRSQLFPPTVAVAMVREILQGFVRKDIVQSEEVMERFIASQTIRQNRGLSAETRRLSVVEE